MAKSWYTAIKNPLFMGLCKEKGYLRPELVFFNIPYLCENFDQFEEANIEDIFKTDVCSPSGLTVPRLYQGLQLFDNDKKVVFRYKNLSLMSYSDKQKGIFYDQYTNDYIAVWVNPKYTIVYNREFAGEKYKYADNDEKGTLYGQFYKSQMTLAHYMLQEQKMFDFEDQYGYEDDDEYCPTADPITAEPKDFVDRNAYENTDNYYYPVILIDSPIPLYKFATKLPQEYVSVASATKDDEE